MTKTTEKEVVEVDSMGMVRALMQVKGPTPATITAITEVKMNKTNNPFYGRVQKHQKSNIFINFDYTAAVNKRLVKEGKEADFVAKPRKWGEHLPNTPIVFHKDTYYLEAGYLTNNTPKAEFLLDGEVADKAQFESFLPAAKSNAEGQGLDEKDEVVLRDFKIDSIIEIAMGGRILRRKNA